jgi:hypothetical protein
MGGSVMSRRKGDGPEVRAGAKSRRQERAKKGRGVLLRDMTPADILVLADQAKERGLGVTPADQIDQRCYLADCPPGLEAAFGQVFPHRLVHVLGFKDAPSRDVLLFERRAVEAVLAAFGVGKAGLRRHVKDGFDYAAHLGELGVSAHPLAGSQLVILATDDQAALCDAADLQAWLLAHAGESKARRERGFDAEFFNKPLGPEGLKRYDAVFDAGTDPEWYVLSSSGWEDWFESWTGAVVRQVAPGWHIEWPPREGAKTLPSDCLMSEEVVEGRASDGWLSAPEDYEEAQEREAQEREAEEDAEGE